MAYNDAVISSARLLHQLMQTDRLFGVEAVPRARCPAAETVQAPPAAASRAPVPADRPMAAPRPAAIASAPVSPVRPSPGTPPPAALWQTALEIPLGGAAPDGPLAVLFVSVEWGLALSGDTRALFDRQVAAMKLAPSQAGLLRMTWTGTDEPHTGALAQAHAGVVAAADQGRPRALVLFGGFSMRAMAGGQLGGSLVASRGRWITWEGAGRSIAAVATWHPGQLGMDRERRAQTWEDLKSVCAKLGI